MSKLLPILMYHEYFDKIREHFQFVEDHYSVVHLKDVVSHFQDPDRPFPKSTIVLTFDDAYQDFYLKILPLLKKHNLKATLCVPTGYIADDENERNISSWEHGSKKPLLLWKELEEITVTKSQEQDSLVEIIPHSVRHIPLDKEVMKTDIENLRFEVGHSKKVLVEKLGIPEPRFFCLPGGAGWGKPLVRQALRENHYVGALKANFNPNEDKSLDLFWIPRWDAHKKNNVRDLLEKMIYEAA